MERDRDETRRQERVLRAARTAFANSERLQSLAWALSGAGLHLGFVPLWKAKELDSEEACVKAQPLVDATAEKVSLRPELELETPSWRADGGSDLAEVGGRKPPSSPSVSTRRKGAVLPIICRECASTGPEAMARAFYQSPPARVTLCSNRLSSPEDIEEVLVHELIHAVDHRVQDADLSQAKHLACSEIRAAREAECGASCRAPRVLSMSHFHSRPEPCSTQPRHTAPWRCAANESHPPVFTKWFQRRCARRRAEAAVAMVVSAEHAKVGAWLDMGRRIGFAWDWPPMQARARIK